MKKLLTVSMFAALLLTACSSQTANAPIVSSLNCSVGMQEYSLDGTPIQFCYDSKWGDVKIEKPGAKTGKLIWVSFSKAPDGPEIWLESDDLLLPDGDSAQFNFRILDASADEKELKAKITEAMGYQIENLKVRKADVGGTKAVRVDMTYQGMEEKDHEIRYYVPLIYEGYNMTISGDYKTAEAVDNLAFDLVVKK